VSSQSFTVELFWRCPHRGSLGVCAHLNAGRSMRCTACNFDKTIDCRDDYLADGTRIEGDDAFTLTEEQAARGQVRDPAVQALFDRGTTWICTVCTPETDNRSTGNPAADTCSRCGTPRLSVGMDRPKAEQVMSEPDFDRARAHEHDADESDGPPPVDPFATERLQPATSPRGRLQGAAKYLLIACAVAGVLFGGWWLFAQHPVHVTVAAVSWERTVLLRRRIVVHGSGWGTPSLSETFNVQCVRRDTGTTESCDPYQCNPHPKQFPAGSHKCNPHQERVAAGQEQCGTQTSREACGTESDGPARCTRSGNGSANCVQPTRTRYCARQTPKYCPKWTTVTVYDDCPDYETRMVYDTCWRQCPVWRNWCEYDHHEWPEADRRSLRGSDTAPRWPSDLTVRSDAERLDRAARQSVAFTDGEHRRWTWDPGERIAEFPAGRKWLIAASRAGTVSPIEPE